MQNNTIPKIIHYCWFGGKPLPEEFKRYIESWKEFCPDYDIREWNETNYDVRKNLYMEQAYNQEKWGFVPDFARLDIIYNHGGIYLDTDVELLKPLDELLKYKAFFGFESETQINLGLGFGAEKGNKLIKTMMNYYEQLSFLNEDGTLNTTASPLYISQVLKNKGLKLNGDFQIIEECAFFPIEYFSPKNYVTGLINTTENSFSIHHFSATWLDWESKKIMKWIQKSHQNGLIYSKLIEPCILLLRFERKIRLEGLTGIIKTIKRRINNH